MIEEILSEQIYKKILQCRFGRSDLEYEEASVEPISENVEGFMGEHYKLKITYKLKDKVKVESFFIKTKHIKNEPQGILANRSNIYQLEIFLYNFLFKEYKKYGFDTSFAPKCYHCIQGNTLIMDDMTAKGFLVPERNKLFGMDECKCGLKSLALFHSAGLMYEEVKKKELGRTFSLYEEYPNMFREKFFTQFINKENSRGAKWFEISREVFCELINLLPETEEYKAEFKKRLREKQLGKIFVEETNIKKCCGHGDLWSNNMLFQMQNEIVTHCCLIDYQVCRYFYPAYDVMLFLLSNTNTEFRQNHLKDLFEFYYKTLEGILKEHGYSITELYPKDDYERSFEIVEFEAKMQAYTVRSLVCLPAEILNKHSDTEVGSSNNVLFNKRVALSVNAFKKDDHYKKIVTADLYDLHSSLFRI